MKRSNLESTTARAENSYAYGPSSLIPLENFGKESYFSYSAGQPIDYSGFW
ncbi:hypothetical protein GCK32_002688 [Trichostrongylus colubriformis]|uniref:Uncharacterized protein n=1 Tax=Trichostrongylus colubriformis TaxID=6319 RepID=A0AAN8F3V9_TRICO